MPTHQVRLGLCIPDVFQVRVLRHEGPFLKPLVHDLFQLTDGLFFPVMPGVDAGHVVIDHGAVRVNIHDLLQMTDLPAYTLAS